MTAICGKELLEKLKDMNIDESQLEDLKDIFEAKNSDIYDVLAHLSFNHNIKTRDERAIDALNSKFIEKYPAFAVLSAVSARPFLAP